MKTKLFALILISLGAAQAQAAVLLSENFDNVGALAGNGWAAVNNSTAGGTTGWFQGDNTAAFSAFNGAANSYIAANFNNAPLGGDISNWLLTPVIDLSAAISISFWTRVDNVGFNDALQLRVSTSGNSANVGGSTASVGDFSNLLVAVGAPAEQYPDAWVRYTVSILGQGAGVTGRIGFRYLVSDTSLNGDYIGIDAVRISEVSEPATLGTMALALLMIGVMGKVRSRRPR